MNKLLVLTLFFACSVFSVCAQETFPTNGPADEREGFHAFTNATIVVSPGTVINNATLVIKNGKVVSATNGTAPKGAVVHNMQGKTIYPSFIELHSDYGVSEVKQPVEPGSRGPQDLSYKKGAFGWNQAIHPEMQTSDHFTVNKKEAKELREIGFGTTLSHITDGIARGTGALVSLAENRENEVLLNDRVSSHFSFSKGSSTQNYPSSLMGTIALLRQSHYDADWYAKTKSSQTNLTLKAWNANKNLPAFFEVGDVLDVLRADKVGEEIGMNFIIVGEGDEYQKIDAIKNTNATMILPLNFPDAYNVENPYAANLVSLEDMKHWEMAPFNAAFLVQKAVPFALTSSKTEKKADFLSNLRKAVESGLSEDKALEALTTKPAQLINMSDKVGSLKNGQLANFLVTSGNIFSDKKAKILENWVQGNQFVIEQEPDEDIVGTYDLTVDGTLLELIIKNKKGKQSFKVQENDTTDLKASGSFENDIVNVFYTTDDGRVRLTGWRSGNRLRGNGVLPSGKEVNWIASVKAADAKSDNSDEKKDDEDEDEEEKTEMDTKKPSINDVMFPFVGYGWKTQPAQNRVLFKNATVWTNENEGILKNTDVLIEDGKIKEIGKNLRARNATEIDATGKHITTGIIDEHSHVAISRGVNEGTQASSSEVRIGDVVNSEHVALYRVLAGGVTASQLLHGSANPIGGQSAIIKSRWGLLPEQMKFEGADGYIKFALGENVKQSNWGREYNSRFPQTRMGVEQVYENYFTLAKEYEKAMQTNPSQTRKDLELDALVEILNKQRFISCHSYVQSEINMLMHVAERHNFRVNTFTHILEGYKVADKMREHGVGGSTFSDWWAYKYEVIDAIPYNATIMAREGVVTAINSDDAEMARRLNQEAGKAMRYGGIPEEEAWKMVTLNPAKLLHIDDKVGSIKKGKDADIVVWSDYPMSIYAIAEQTYVDGRKYFDAKEDAQKQQEIRMERERIIQKMLSAKKGGAKTQEPKKKEGNEYSCKMLGETGSHTTKHSH